MSEFKKWDRDGGGQGSYGGGGGWQKGNNNGGGGYQRNGGGKGSYGGGQFKKKDEGPAVFYRPGAFVSNKDAPPQVIDQLIEAVKLAESKSCTIRVTGLDGPDDAMEKAAVKPEVHLPWKDFNQKNSGFSFVTDQALEMTRKFHSGFDGLSQAVQKIVSSSVRIVLGKGIASPALFLVCYSEDGAESYREKTTKTGNLSLPLRVASELGIPVFNFGKRDGFSRFSAYMNSIESTLQAIPSQPQHNSQGNNHYDDF